MPLRKEMVQSAGRFSSWRIRIPRRDSPCQLTGSCDRWPKILAAARLASSCRERGPSGSTAARPKRVAEARPSWCEPVCSTTAMPRCTGIRRDATRLAIHRVWRGLPPTDTQQARVARFAQSGFRHERQVGKGSTDVGDVSWVVPTTGFTTACYVPGTRPTRGKPSPPEERASVRKECNSPPAPWPPVRGTCSNNPTLSPPPRPSRRSDSAEESTTRCYCPDKSHRSTIEIFRPRRELR